MKEIITLINFLEKENGLDSGIITEVLEKSIETVARKKEELPPVKVTIDEEGNINMTSVITVVPEEYLESLRNEDGTIEEPDDENIVNPMTIQDAQRYYPKTELEEGMQYTSNYNYDEVFGRIDVQTIKQIT